MINKDASFLFNHLPNLFIFLTALIMIEPTKLLTD